ncbi:MAG: hypothetical protein ACREQ9_06255 [Candidatus Binatia bacterium]
MRARARHGGLVEPVALSTFVVFAGFTVIAVTDSYFTNSGVGDALWTPGHADRDRAGRCQRRFRSEKVGKTRLRHLRPPWP